MTKYYNHFNAEYPDDTLLFIQDRPLQSAEMNALQSFVVHRQRSVADAIYKDGDIIKGAQIIVDPETGRTRCESGSIYLDGAVRGIPPAELHIPTTGIVYVGIYLKTVIRTELDDPSYYNPAVGTRTYMEPGAHRERKEPRWGVAGESGEFYPVWTIEDGNVRSKEPPPNMDGVTQALARYDRDSAGGSYIVSGLVVTRLPDLATGQQVYTLAEGRARVNGYAIEQQASRRIVYDALPDLKMIDSEPHQSTTDARQRINLDRTPAAGELEVRITAQRTITLTHGGFGGAGDPLPDNAVIEIVSVIQGGKTYAKGSDYVLTAGQVDWSPPGAEVAPGSAYQVTYRYIAKVTPIDPDPTGFEVEGALTGTMIHVTYRQQLPRIDRLCLESEGNIVWIKGHPADWSPVAPAVPSHLLLIASVHQRWDDSTRVVMDGVKVVPMQEIAGLSRRMDAITEDQAELRLAVDVSGRDSGIKKGLYADPFLSDEMRDKGMAQSAAIVGGGLRLPIASVVHQVGLDMTGPVTLAHTHRVVIDQPLRTGSMLVNPYMAFRPLPAVTTLTPQVDRWTEVTAQWTSAVTERFYTGSGSQSRYTGSTTSTRVVSESRTDLEFLRSISVRFDLQGFVPGEGLSSVTFDGLAVTPVPLSGGTLVANTSGKLSGTLTVPEKVPAGTKNVVFTGTGGSSGSQLFTGQGTAVLRVQQQVTTENWTNSNPTPPPNNGDDIVIGPWPAGGNSTNQSSGCQNQIVIGPSTDPLSQTFSVTELTQMSGVSLIFTAKSTEVVVQVREANQGVPTATGLIEQRVPAATIKVGEVMRVTWPPVTLQPGREYAIVVLCDDDKTALSIATLGEQDTYRKQWVTSQPYQVGVLLSSSNANTWTPHQDKDMTFGVLAPVYTETERVIDLGTAGLVAATDLMVLGFADLATADAGVVFEVDFPSGQKVQLSDGQVVWLASPMTCTVQVSARLRGSQKIGAVLQPGIQLIAGTIAATADYITRTVTAGDDSTVKVIYEAALPGGASVVVHVQDSTLVNAAWIEVPYVSASSPTAGVREITHVLEGFSAPSCRVRLTLQGSTSARPSVHNLRVVVL